MKTVYLVTLDNAVQLSILQNALQEEGIESFVKNENMASVLNTPGFQMEVEVMEEDYERAFEVLMKGFPYLAGG